MIINEKLLQTYGAQMLTFKKDEYLIASGSSPKNYYQVVSGNLKITSGNSGHNEFIHQLISIGDPVGETFLFADNLYTINAVALNSVTVYALSRSNFDKLLAKHPEMRVRLYEYAVQCINYERQLMNKMAYSGPREKIIIILDYLKRTQKQYQSLPYEVPCTRKQLASLAGLRTETVVRTIKLMEKENSVKIVEGKVYY